MKRIYCKCGCGRYAASRNRSEYAYGHKPQSSVPDLRFCNCGCGEYAKLGNDYILGHNQKGRNGGFSGHHHTKESRTKISSAQVGKLVSKITGAKLSKALTGHLVSEDQRRNQSEAMCGDNVEWTKFHPYIKEYELRRIKDDVRKRDGRCVICGYVGWHKLDVHHVVPVRIGYRSRLCDHESNMIALCRRCHGGVEKNLTDRWKEFLPASRRHLSLFGYKKLLLNRYYETRNEPIHF